MKDPTIHCSVEILSFNNAGTIEKAISSVRECDEIIIIDGGSTDDTLEIARRHGCLIIEQDKQYKNRDETIADFASLRNQGLARSKHDWFLFVDSDEYMTEKCMSEIRDIVETNIPAAYWIPRKYVLEGQVVECSSLYPTQQMRFFHKDAVTEFRKPVHERIVVKEGALVRRMKNFMCVPFDTNWERREKKMDRYVAIEMQRMGKISFGTRLRITLKNFLLSLLYLFRYTRNAVLCRGKKLPFKYELGAHAYHLKIVQSLWKNHEF